ncbi:THO complex subunit 5 homolog B isoform X2 [Hyalella azteca]|uniref:THO complex subunit 5 homolog B isoform X2 n=1 Tax=Hyalella azteca TaxID=294128 RepID=A0A8B7NPX8_HYAAZ|nr:THO complex subunit 5 homolog B isoform X2 [Hyalella azteca]
MASEDSKKLAGEVDSDEVEVISVTKKSNTVEEANEGPAKDLVKSQIDLYKDALAYEEAEVAQRKADADQQHFLQTNGAIRSIMQEILKLKLKQPEKCSEAVEEQRVKAMMLILNMRKLSRTQKVRVRLAREEALDARQSVDGVTLQLQGLLYEVLHLQKEAQRCLLAHTADKDVDLLPVEQFYEEAPPSISRPDVTRSDPHQQRLARLHWELEQRRGQTSLGEQLSSELHSVQVNISELNTKLAAIRPCINDVLQSTIPLQEALGLPLTAMRKQQEAAQLLPMPLYTLWMQCSAYSEAGDPLVCSMIRGDTDAAAKLQQQQHEEQHKTSAAAAAAEATEAAPGDADSDNDPEDSNDVSSHKSRDRSERSGRGKTHVPSSSSSSNAAAVDPMQQMLELHPLHVEVTVSTPDGSSVVIQFHYAMQLRLVTTRTFVLAKTLPPVPGAVVYTDVLTGPDFLDELFPGDGGVVSPNPATIHQLRRLQPHSAFLHHPALIPPQLGRAYKWAQQLAGLAFPALQQEETRALKDGLVTVAEEIAHEGGTEVSSERVHVTLSALRRRLKARLVLQQHLLSLQSANSTSCIPVPSGSVSALFPGKVSCELVSWRPVSWQDYNALSATAALRDAGLAVATSFFFRALYQRRHVEMSAYVCVSADYPNTVPLFALDLKWGDQPCPHAHVQQLEAEVNVHWSDLLVGGTDKAHILPLMLYRLAMCLDVYTEAVSSRLNPSDAAGPLPDDSMHFHKEKIFFRSARGPDRAFPLKYLPKLRVFAQR